MPIVIRCLVPADPRTLRPRLVSCLPLGHGGNALYAPKGRRKKVKMKLNALCCVFASHAAENMRMALPIHHLFPLLSLGLKRPVATFRELIQWSPPGLGLGK
ncbi:hypothetical protein VM1G_11499 [Cytospora mali]|uniref:Uncharacterized protein n=1 Tax=Cytospora mali TaxID=578113 RepID=A0A194VU55_CYTMA|nr:hypothetical protein VM1G_11499 [Valsa mali]